MVCGALLKSSVWLGVILSLSGCIVVFSKYVCVCVCVCVRAHTPECAIVVASRDRDRLKNLAQELKKKRQMSE